MRKQKPLPGVNMTPMIDVVFLIIIFFICTMDLEKDKFDENVILAWARSAQAVGQEDPLTVTVNVREDGTIKIGKRLMSARTFQAIMQKTVNRYGTGVPVVIRGDRLVLHEHISRLTGVCKSVGIWKVKFAAIISEGE